MPLTGIVELSSPNERQRGQFTSEQWQQLGRKGRPRPARVTRRSRRACLRLGDAQRERKAKRRWKRHIGDEAVEMLRNGCGMGVTDALLAGLSEMQRRVLVAA